VGGTRISRVDYENRHIACSVKGLPVHARSPHRRSRA
jgi:hypothetical protein